MPTRRPQHPSRRGLLKYFGLLTGAVALPPTIRAFGAASTPAFAPSALPIDQLTPAPLAAASLSSHRVVLVKTTDRAAGVRQAIDQLQPPSFSRKTVFIKPNYNTGDPAPASTDTVVLETLVQEIQQAGATSITVGDRSGMATTRDAMTQQQVFALAQRYGFTPLVFSDIPA
ncbi:MAG: DUF362 domain-containing protein [Nodosilinea sp.]